MGFDIFMLGITIVIAGGFTWLILWFFFPKGEIAPTPASTIDKDIHDDIAATQRMFIIAAVLTIPVFLITMLPLVSEALIPLWLRSPWLQAVLITPVMFYCGKTIHDEGWHGIMHRAPNIDSIVSLGSWAAYLYSLVICFAPDIVPQGSRDPYFEAVGIIITLVLLGKLLAIKVRAGSGEAVSGLQRLYPQQSHKLAASEVAALTKHNQTAMPSDPASIPYVDVNTETLNINDVILVQAGERIPADAIVLSGSARIDDSPITGNSQSIRVESGHQVYATSLVIQGFVIITVTQTGASTLLGRIITMVSKARSTAAPLETFALRLSRIIVTGVIILAIWTFAIWIVVGPQPRLSHALVTGISVLIVACPCALALATPLSAFIAMNLGATQGILMSSGMALSKARNITKLCFDSNILTTHDTRNPRETLAALHKANIATAMFSKDCSPSTLERAAAYGIDEIIPLDTHDMKHSQSAALNSDDNRAQWIRHFVSQRSENECIAMVGDAQRDALAFKEADVAFAMGTASQEAMQSADITILSGDMQGVLHAISLSRQTISNMRENLVWSLIYNVLGIPFAMGILYPFTGWLLTPAIAGLAMTFSVICVIVNAYRLSKADIKHTWQYVQSDESHRPAHIATRS